MKGYLSLLAIRNHVDRRSEYCRKRFLVFGRGRDGRVSCDVNRSERGKTETKQRRMFRLSEEKVGFTGSSGFLHCWPIDKLTAGDDATRLSLNAAHGMYLVKVDFEDENGQCPGQTDDSCRADVECVFPPRVWDATAGRLITARQPNRRRKGRESKTGSMSVEPSSGVDHSFAGSGVGLSGQGEVWDGGVGDLANMAIPTSGKSSFHL